ncbi:hypothetical protein P170DRAFT_424054 [Aspergillus steynii IBT 23096]|uniref:Uncharacterized protein n=1 Tax=Aspergillus steynii IBT 23096 TaxID=1392250 RepID=A0A2I2GK82_9EURO|nr:uncharacterized protein P170DRAFT_424054 [Aspergillus steynii IBT 23096]PLB53298.1 hypothetical protein P170DRAFT_424054 [Aspergillus steynii IBT 23096]
MNGRAGDHIPSSQLEIVFTAGSLDSIKLQFLNNLISSHVTGNQDTLFHSIAFIEDCIRLCTFFVLRIFVLIHLALRGKTSKPSGRATYAIGWSVANSASSGILKGKLGERTWLPVIRQCEEKTGLTIPKIAASVLLDVCAACAHSGASGSSMSADISSRGKRCNKDGGKYEELHFACE